MNGYLVCMMAILSADAPADAQPTIYRSSERLAAAVRAQSPPPSIYEGAQTLPPGGMGYPSQPPAYGAPPTSPYMNPMQAPMVDPFLGPVDGGVPAYIGGAPGQFAFGPNGPQALKIGWDARADVFFMPKEFTETPGLGRFGISGINAEAEYTNVTALDWIFSFTQQFGSRWWDGPSGAVGLPGDVYRIGWDFEYATPRGDYGPWGVQFGFNPSINSSFEGSLNSSAYLWDGRAVLTYEVAPELQLAAGAGYWDRVRDRVIPYAGFVWTPNDRWEFQMTFPESKISYFVGTSGSVAQWLYLRGAYRVEAYQVETGIGPNRSLDQVEIEDWRILFGYQADGGFATWLVEAGWVFGRDVAFLRNTQPGFDIRSGFIARTGITF